MGTLRPMRVHELIAALADCAPDAEVLLPGYEGGMSRVTGVESTEVHELDRHGHQPYLGRFETAVEAARQSMRSRTDFDLAIGGYEPTRACRWPGCGSGARECVAGQYDSDVTNAAFDRAWCHAIDDELTRS